MEWKPIDTAPSGVEVLLYEPFSGRYESLGLSHKRADNPGGKYTGIKNEDGRWKYSFMGQEETRDDYFGDHVSPTRWMPMPDDPK